MERSMKTLNALTFIRAGHSSVQMLSVFKKCWMLCVYMPGLNSQCLVNGISLFDGALWSPEPCSVCQCKDGAVNCRTIPCQARGGWTVIALSLLFSPPFIDLLDWCTFSVIELCKRVNFTSCILFFHVCFIPITWLHHRITIYSKTVLVNCSKAEEDVGHSCCDVGWKLCKMLALGLVQCSTRNSAISE